MSIDIGFLKKLKGEDNYIFWKKQLNYFFDANGIEDPYTDKPEDEEAVNVWKKNQRRYYAMVMLAIEGRIYYKVPEDKMSCVNEILKVLDAEFKINVGIAYQMLLLRIINLKQNDCKSLEDFLDKMTKLFAVCMIHIHYRNVMIKQLNYFYQ
ncbi:hypothetical protein PVAND_003495 [Polypedilum vanderplanki]|uniref:Uncharacterized protein n=1 Tax=Polypedilum vanderplanki TaxID=319348 RepID=A0A9J6BU81_POLVA|nr:hypothetical protein PVAND_003495 [Polypedilum vanderplanki]